MIAGFTWQALSSAQASRLSTRVTICAITSRQAEPGRIARRCEAYGRQPGLNPQHVPADGGPYGISSTSASQVVKGAKKSSHVKGRWLGRWDCAPRH